MKKNIMAIITAAMCLSGIVSANVYAESISLEKNETEVIETKVTAIDVATTTEYKFEPLVQIVDIPENLENANGKSITIKLSGEPFANVGGIISYVSENNVTRTINWGTQLGDDGLSTVTVNISVIPEGIRKCAVKVNGSHIDKWEGSFDSPCKIESCEVDYNFNKKNNTLSGDANCDGSVDMSDAVMIMQSLANPDKYGIDGTAEHHLTEQGKLNGDMNGDGLTVGDAQDIQKMLLGLKE